MARNGKQGWWWMVTSRRPWRSGDIIIIRRSIVTDIKRIKELLLERKRSIRSADSSNVVTHAEEVPRNAESIVL